MILLIDNYDSFTYNLYQAVRGLGAEVRVVRNDKIGVEGIRRMRPERILISPGPGRPEQAGVAVAAVRAFAGKAPILGVCLGHQAIGIAFGGRVVRARRLMHGKTSRIRHDGRGVYRGMPNPFTATRYHSLIVERKTLPACLEATAGAEDGTLMGLRHRALAVEGVQFHPESIMTPEGSKLLANFLRMRCGSS